MHIRLGEIIKDAREYKEITRAELAEYTFVSEEKIVDIEEDRTVPDFDTALLICNFLDIEVIEKGVDVNVQSEEGYTVLLQMESDNRV
jgi:transcriptional regulator with XRE-family HTH domain